MILDEKLKIYLDYLLDFKRDYTDDIYEKQFKEKRPIIFRDVARFICQIVLLKNPDSILEIGTNAGYSTIILEKNTSRDCKIITMDINEDNLNLAEENFKQLNIDHKITAILGDANSILKELDSKFDLIFIDADKINNLNYLDYAVRHINDRGIILVDNLLWKKRVYLDDTKKSTLSIKNFNEHFMKLINFETSVLSIGDGLGVAIKK